MSDVAIVQARRFGRILARVFVIAAVLLGGILGALVQQWRIDARDDFSFVDCDGKRQTVTRDDRFAIIIGDSGCMRLLRTPEHLSVTCTIDKRVAPEEHAK